VRDVELPVKLLSILENGLFIFGRVLRLPVIVLAWVCMASVMSAATQSQVVVSGIVSDTSGGVVPGARVEAIVNGRVFTVATSDSSGSYRLVLSLGTVYQLRVSVNGFTTVTLEPVVARYDSVANVELRVGALNQTIVVTASGTERSLANVAESISVFTSEDLEAIGAMSVADVLRIVPGFNLEATGREGSMVSLFSRGAESDYNLVIIDGVRVNISGGEFDFSRISAGEIDRVEVVRGSQSALYGSDAIGSVIQVFTKRAGASEVPVFSGSFEGGNFNTRRGDLQLVGGANNRVDYRLGVAIRGTDGAFADVLDEKDRFDQATYNFGVGALINNRISIRTGLRYSNARGRLVGPIAYGSRDTGSGYNTTNLSWSLESEHVWTPVVRGTARVGYFRYSANHYDTVADPTYNLHAILSGTPGRKFPNSPRLERFVEEAEFSAITKGIQSLRPGQLLATTPWGISDYLFTLATKFRRPTFDYTAAWTWQQDQVLSAGYAWERQSDPLLAGLKITNHAYFAQQQFTVADDWFLSLGARVDDNSHFGINISPKLSVGGYPVPFADQSLSSFKVFASVGRGLKNPSFGELFGSTYADGNPNLGPETAVTIDAGAELTFDSQRVKGSVTYFNSKYRDQVAYFSTGFGIDGEPDFINVNGSESNGWEIAMALQRPLAGVTGAVTYSYVDTNVTATVSSSQQFQAGQPLLRRPKHAGTLHVGYQKGPASINIDVRWVGQRHDSGFLFMTSVPTSQYDEVTSVDVTVNPSHTLVGLGAEVEAHEALKLFIRVDNLTDELYESALGYPGSPRSVVVGMRFTIGR
jgi:outer membrane cobalamin receptor